MPENAEPLTHIQLVMKLKCIFFLQQYIPITTADSRF